MTRPRKHQVSLEATPYYHCISRCVRRAFLCGYDRHTETSYEHRRGWLEEEMLQQAKVFAIDIAAYAIMSNHYHVVLHINAKQANAWTLDTIIERWHALFKGNQLSQRYERGDSLTKSEMAKLKEDAEIWRARLMDISWFMRRINESIARQANREDQCTGRFWEGRFKSQALLDEKALAACMAYVDLNPVRANVAKTPETSDHTSIQTRCKKAKSARSPNHPHQQPKTLMPFAGNPRQPMLEGLPFRLTDYIELVDWTGRILREDKRGSIAHQLPSILSRLGIEVESWQTITREFEETFKGFVGSSEALTENHPHFSLARASGKSQCQRYLG